MTISAANAHLSGGGSTAMMRVTVLVSGAANPPAGCGAGAEVDRERVADTERGLSLAGLEVMAGRTTVACAPRAPDTAWRPVPAAPRRRRELARGRWPVPAGLRVAGAALDKAWVEAGAGAGLAAGAGLGVAVAVAALAVAVAADCAVVAEAAAESTTAVTGTAGGCL
jgi:hypothetical protein